MFATNQWQMLVHQMKAECGIEFDDGLTDHEIADVEQRFKFCFPSDLREFLQIALPVSQKFPNWRSDSAAALRDRLQMPLEGVLFDVEQNHFWQSAWGLRPNELNDALTHARKLVAAAPTLIPIYSHRMMPDRPQQSGNPVFSVHQTDIIPDYSRGVGVEMEHACFIGVLLQVCGFASSPTT